MEAVWFCPVVDQFPCILNFVSRENGVFGNQRTQAFGNNLHENRTYSETKAVGILFLETDL